MTDLDVERETVERALAHSGTGWDAWPDVAATAAWTQRERLAALLLLLSTPECRVELGNGDHQLLPDPGDDVIDVLRRGALPWDAETARLGLEVVAERGFDDRRVRVVLRAAEGVCATGRADVHLVDELRAFASWLEVHPHRYGLAEARLAVARALAAVAPAEVLDLSLVHDGDRWGPQAREAARRTDAEVVAPLVRVLGELGHREPTPHWSERVADALREPAARQLLKDWLVLACEVEVGHAPTATGCVRPAVLAPGNEDVVRAAVLATRHVDDTSDPDGVWVARVLGFLARRGASTRPDRTSPALTVAGAAADTLAAREVRKSARPPEPRTEVLGDQLPSRSHVELRRRTAQRTRRAPRRAREAVDLLLAQHVVPTLRSAGFVGTGRTLRRRHPDRVDVVHLGSAGENLVLSYGVWFDAAHPHDHPQPQDPDRVLAHHLDVRLVERWEAVGDELDRCAAHLTREVLPFLDTFAVYELAREHLQDGGVVPTGAQVLGTPSCPAHQEVLGLLSLAVGDRPTAVQVLSQQVARLGGFVDCDRGVLAGNSAERAFWVERLEQAERLAVGEAG